MRDAGLDDAADVHYVQTKTPLLTIESVARRAPARPQRRLRGPRVDGRVERHDRARHRRRARGDPDAAVPEQICRDFDLYSSVASCSSGVELTRAQIVPDGQPRRRRRPVSHRPQRDEGRARPRRHLRRDPQRRPRAAGAAREPRISAGASSTASSSARRTTAGSCGAGARSCSTTRTCIITATPRPRSGRWSPPAIGDPAVSRLGGRRWQPGAPSAAPWSSRTRSNVGE